MATPRTVPRPTQSTAIFDTRPVETRKARVLNEFPPPRPGPVTPDVQHPHQGINPLTPNDPYRGHTAPLTSKRCILYIYSINTGTEYFKMVYTLHFFLFKMQLVS